MIHAGLLSLDDADGEAPQELIDSDWRTHIEGRLEDVLEGVDHPNLPAEP